MRKFAYMIWCDKRTLLLWDLRLNSLLGSQSEGEGEEDDEGEVEKNAGGGCASSASVKSSAHQILNRLKGMWRIDSETETRVEDSRALKTRLEELNPAEWISTIQHKSSSLFTNTELNLLYVVDFSICIMRDCYGEHVEMLEVIGVGGSEKCFIWQQILYILDQWKQHLHQQQQCFYQ